MCGLEVDRCGLQPPFLQLIERFPATLPPPCPVQWSQCEQLWFPPFPDIIIIIMMLATLGLG